MPNGKLYVKYSWYEYAYRGPNIKILLCAQKKTLISICSRLPMETYFKSFSLLFPRSFPILQTEFTSRVHPQTCVQSLCSFCIDNSIELHRPDDYRLVL